MDVNFHRIKNIYPIWFLISLTILLVISIFNLEQIILPLVIALLIKDITIDIFYKIKKPSQIEHAPLVMLITVFGIAGLLEIPTIAIVIAGIDFPIDFIEDLFS